MLLPALAVKEKAQRTICSTYHKQLLPGAHHVCGTDNNDRIELRIAAARVGGQIRLPAGWFISPGKQRARPVPEFRERTKRTVPAKDYFTRR
jgi:hypothetical protein